MLNSWPAEAQGNLATGDAASSPVQAAPAPKASFASGVADLGWPAKLYGIARWFNVGISINGDTTITGWFIMENPMNMDDVQCFFNIFKIVLVHEWHLWRKSWLTTGVVTRALAVRLCPMNSYQDCTSFGL